MAKAQPQSNVTQTLAAIREGDKAAKDRLVGLIYEDLRAAARRLMRRERTDHTLQPTALVNESLMRLMDTTALGRIEDRGHLIAAATIAFKRILVDHARARATRKRGGDFERRPLSEVVDREPDRAAGAAPHAPPDMAPPDMAPPDMEGEAEPFETLLTWYDEHGLDILALDEALEEMRAVEERWFDVILLRFFGGLTIEQTAALIGVSPRTVAQDWNQARAWLRVRLGDDDGREDGAATPTEGPLREGEPPGG